MSSWCPFQVQLQVLLVFVLRNIIGFPSWTLLSSSCASSPFPPHKGVRIWRKLSIDSVPSIEACFWNLVCFIFYFIFRKYPRHKGACRWNKCKCFWGERIRQKEKRWQECKLEFTGKFSGSRVAEWLERWTCHSEVPSSSQGPWLLSEFVLGSSEFKSSVTFVKIQLTGLTPTSYDS